MKQCLTVEQLIQQLQQLPPQLHVLAVCNDVDGVQSVLAASVFEVDETCSYVELQLECSPVEAV